MQYLAIIPARGGSKGIPNKNMANLAGHPLIWYTLEAVRHSRLKNHIFLSSDTPEIISFSKRYCIHSDYVRPAKLATDQASSSSVVVDVIKYLENKNQFPENFILLQPTSPIRTGTDIDLALEHFEKSGKHSMVGVTRMREHPAECIKTVSNKLWTYLEKSQPNARRQDYVGNFYFINGAIYICKTEEFLKTKRFVIEGETELFEMPSEHAIDIDEEMDLLIAEAYLQNRTKKGAS